MIRFFSRPSLSSSEAPVLFFYFFLLFGRLWNLYVEQVLRHFLSIEEFGRESGGELIGRCRMQPVLIFVPRHLTWEGSRKPWSASARRSISSSSVFVAADCYRVRRRSSPC